MMGCAHKKSRLCKQPALYNVEELVPDEGPGLAR